ncbi:hypothetical protein DH09_16835 [Bacillaceae bacterium JMAK1]|nr:hypothetical protein DH09_16835 [Bacillaceae bacterium JMAK1]
MALTLNGSGKIIGNKELLPPIDLAVQNNEIAAIQADIEHMDAFLSLLENDKSYLANEIMYDGNAVAGPDELFIYSPDMGEYPRLTPEKMVRFWGQLYGVEIDIAKILTLTELTHVRTKKIKLLTYYEKKRLQFARSLIQKTSIYVFKEPTYQLDLQSKKVFNHVLTEIKRMNGVVILLTSSLEEGIRLGSKVFRLNERGMQEVELDEEIIEQEEVKDELTNDEELFQQRFEKISAKTEDKFILFDPLEIDYIETRERQTVLHVNNEEFYSTVTLKDLESKLLPYGFYRCHRSYLVNLQRVREVIVWSKNSYSLTLDNRNEQVVPLSKSKYGELKALLNW